MPLRSTKAVMSALMLAAVLGSQASGYRAQILPDMLQHLDCARSCARKGEFEAALAHTDIVLLNHQVKVFVTPGTADRDMGSLCLQSLAGATTMWEEAIGGDLRFIEAKTEREADIVVRFDGNVYSSRGEEVGGTVNWTRTIITDSTGTKGVVKAQIKVRTRVPGGGNMSFEQMRHVACHELGHVLGLGDSPRIGDVMGPLDLRRPATVLSVDEVQALRDVRESASEVRRDAIQKVVLHLRV
jgi:hypothetical protein